MTKHTIEIEGLPEGWEPVAYRKPLKNEFVFYPETGEIFHASWSITPAIRLIVQKTQPREITLVETEEDNEHLLNSPMYVNQWVNLDILLVNQPKIWRIKEE